MTAKTHGLDELAREILESAGLTEADIHDLPSSGMAPLKPPPVVTPTTTLNWPSISVGESFFEHALANGNLEAGMDVPFANGAEVAGTNALDAWAKEETQGDVDVDEGGWDLDADGDVPPTISTDQAISGADEELGAGATPGISETELWIRNSPFAADHVAAGSFDTAMQVC
jgi:coatomer protein complex subunit alpha (xenin)